MQRVQQEYTKSTIFSEQRWVNLSERYCLKGTLVKSKSVEYVWYIGKWIFESNYKYYFAKFTNKSDIYSSFEDVTIYLVIEERKGNFEVIDWSVIDGKFIHD